VNMESIGALTSSLNPFVVYGFAVFLTLLVILNRARLVILPRPLVLVSWYTVVVLAVSWLLFHGVYIFTHDAGRSRLVSFALILSFSPVYVCALIVLFMYPRKPPSDKNF